MLKKTLKAAKIIIIGAVWTFIYVYFANLLTFKFFNFSLVNPDHWKIISSFWESGGVISTGRDYLFLFTLIMLVPLWIIGFRCFYKTNYLNLLLFPIVFYNNRTIKKYGENSPRIVLKNIGKGSKIDVKDIIEARLAQNKKGKKAEQPIRQLIQEKINKAKK